MIKAEHSVAAEWQPRGLHFAKGASLVRHAGNVNPTLLAQTGGVTHRLPNTLRSNDLQHDVCAALLFCNISLTIWGS
jgi:hypothetical protein